MVREASTRDKSRSRILDALKFFITPPNILNITRNFKKQQQQQQQHWNLKFSEMI